ncbi:MAG: glycine cleavage system aminomethyltransferase GcvT [Pseudomonadota bacterium]
MMNSTPQPNKTPLNSWHKANGARMIDFGGWEMPVQYSPGILQEHLRVRKFGGLFDVSHMGRFRIKGKDKWSFLQHALTNNCYALDPWQAHYTIVQNDQGGAIDDTYLYRFGMEDLLLVVNASNRERVWNHFQNKSKNFSDLSLIDDTEGLAMIAFQGPLTKQILESVMEGGHLPEPYHNSLSQGKICGTDLYISRTGYTGEPLGFELFPPAQIVEDVWNTIFEAGRSSGVLPIGLGARDTLRLEANMPLYGHELGKDAEGKEIPIFALSLAPVAVSFNVSKGDFIGREALLKQFQDYQKTVHWILDNPSEHLPLRVRPIAVLDKGVARQGDPIFWEDKRIGFVTSGTTIPYWRFDGEGSTMTMTDSHQLRAIALALVDSTLPFETEVVVAGRKKSFKARIVRWHGRSEAPPYFRSIPVDYEKPSSSHPSEKVLEKVTILLRKSIENHTWRQLQCINLIPSEQTPSPLVRLLSVSDPMGRYAEHKELIAAFEKEVFYYQGTDFIAWVESQLGEEMKTFLDCPLVEVRPVSGQMANMTVFSALVDWKNRDNRKSEPKRIRLVLNNHIGRGGHLSAQPMGALRDFVSKDPLLDRFAVVPFPIELDNPYRINVPETLKLLDQIDPELIIFGKSMMLHPEPVSQIRTYLAQRNPRPLILYDIAHVIGLTGPYFQWPFNDGADIVTGSTHKTFFGTQRGVIGGNFAGNTPLYELWKTIERRAFPGMVSNHHLGTLLGQLLATLEMNAFKDEYQPQVIKNAKAFARALFNNGLKVEGDPKVNFTETHQVIINVGYTQGPSIARILENNNIIVNYQAIPSDESFTASSALRLGVSEMTRFGMKEKDFESFSPLLADAIKGKKVRDEVIKFRGNFLKLGYCFDERDFQPFKKKLLASF